MSKLSSLWVVPSDSLLLDAHGGGSGGGRASGMDVTALPEVPQPDESDLEVLAGDDDDATPEGEPEPEAETDKDDDEDVEKPPKEKKKAEEKPKEKAKPKEGAKEGEEFDIDEGDDLEEGKKKPAEGDEADKGEKQPTFRAIKAKYPQFFKEFPDVGRAITEHRQFKNLFTTPEEAQEAATQSQAFNQVADSLFAGDFATLYDEIRKEDEEAVVKLAKNILPTIKDKNERLYLDLTEPSIKEFLFAAMSRGDASGNKMLKNSTYHLWQFLTGEKAFPKLGNNGPDPRDKAFDERVQNFERQKGMEAQNDVYSDIEEQMMGLIESAIDPKGELKEFTRKAVFKAALNEVDQLLTKDEGHQSRNQRLWQQARRSSFSRGHLSRITEAYLERAKRELPRIAKKVRAEHNITASQPERQDERRSSEAKQTPPARPGGGAPASQKTLRDTNPRNIDWSKTSDADIFAGRARLKGRS